MRTILVISMALLLAPPLAAQSAVQTKDGRLSVVQGASGPRVRNERGYSNPLYIADEVDLSSLVGLRSGWLAAGDQPVGPRRELYFRMLDAGGLKRLPAPPGQAAAQRRRPVLLSDGESLQGVLWLEGDGGRSMSVRASRWLGITWSGPATVSDVGPGTQTALDSAVLPDGSWLAVWAAFDGEDDEIMWSIGVDGSWSAPAALSVNAVPDIQPTVVASADGALVAWNQYDDGEYRVVTMQLREGRWMEPRKEEHGTVYPELAVLDGQPTLLFLDLSQPRSVWRVRELDRETGEAVRSVAVEGDDTSHPLLLTGDRGPYLEWPGGGARKTIGWEPK